VFTAVVLLFLFLGGLLSLFASQVGMTVTGDRIFSAVVFGYLPGFVQIIFIIALISALFPSADGAITALTSSTCIDLLDMQRRNDWSAQKQTRVRRQVHLAFSALFLLLVLGFKWINDPSMVGLILKIAAYTYGPLLGLFAFGFISRRAVSEQWVPWIALTAPVICFAMDAYQRQLFGNYEVGLELLLINAALTALGLRLTSRLPQENRRFDVPTGGRTDHP
jgi:Na+/proline symporter